MMVNNEEKNGILGYGNSKRKKIKENLYGSTEFNAFPTEERVAINSSMSDLSNYMNSEQQRLSAPVDAVKREKEYMASARDYIVPEDNELRRRRQFVMSDRAVKDVTDGYYDSRVKNIFEREKENAAERAYDTYKNYLSVPGADPVAATGAMHNENDPHRVVRNTIQKLNGDELDDIAGSYARYARLSPEKYRKRVLEPAIEQRIMGEYINEATPKSSAEYIARSAFDNSLTGKLIDLGQKAYSPSSSHFAINRAGLEAYDANRGERLAAGIGSLVVDMPAFAAIGGVSSKAVGGTVSNVAKGLSSNLVKKYASRGMQLPEAERIIKRAIVGKMGAKIAQSSAMQGATLGGYDAANSMADDLLFNDGIDVGKAVDAYAHGFTTGIAVGAVGTPLKELSRGLTGGKKIASSAGVLGAESAVFTLSSNADKFLSGVDVEPIDLLYNYGESMATLGAMKLAHWRPRGGSVKLGADGKLKHNFRLTKIESRELTNAGVDPHIFISALEDSFKTSASKKPESIEAVKSDYLKLMSSKELSASTRSKLLYLVENKITSTPPVAVDCVVQESDGVSRATLLDAAGRRISTEEFGSKADLETFLLRIRSELRKNKIASCEEALLGKYDSENFFRQAGRYAEEEGINVNDIAEAMYKRANEQPLSEVENKMLGDISHRTSYGDKGVGQMLYNLRRRLEREYNLHEGSLLAAIDRKAYRCSPAENMALDRYLGIMQQEVEALKDGTSANRRAALEISGANSPYGSLGNEEIKAREIGRYTNFVNDSDSGWLNSNSYPEFTEGNGDGYTRRIKVPQNWDKPYAWSYSGLRNSYEDMKRYQQHASEMAAKLGRKLNFYFDERDIEVGTSDLDYNRKLVSTGWIDNYTGKVYINLPNIKDMGELERVVIHEVVGHGGLSYLFGDYIYDFYEDLYKMADNEVRAGIHDIGKRYDAGGYTAVEEYLAHLAEKNAPTSKERNLLGKVKEYVNNMLERMNIISSDKAKVTTKELCNMLSAHHQAMLNRTAPADYRAKVFGKFPSAHLGEKYYNTHEFNKEIEKRISENRIFEGTPEYLLSDKHLLYDDFSPIPNFRNSGNSYRFIGEKGAQNLSESPHGRSFEFIELANAKEMEKKGVDPDKIWAETGWARGADGEWRSEMEYRDMQYNDVVYNKLMLEDRDLADAYRMIRNKPVVEYSQSDKQLVQYIYDRIPSFFDDLKVRDVVNDPIFYAAYPELANIPVATSSSMKETCYYDYKNKTLYLNKKALLNPERIAQEIVKPVQQMIQHYEGFEKSVSMLRADTEEAFYDEYLQAVGIVNKIEAYKKSGTNDALRHRLENWLRSTYHCTSENFKKMFPTIHEYILSKVVGKNHSFMGNVELRNVENRRLVGSTERMLNDPSKTEDFPREKQLSLELFKEMHKMLEGPMDVIYKNVVSGGYDRSMKLLETNKKVEELHLTPFEKKILEKQYDEAFSKLIDLYVGIKRKGAANARETLRKQTKLIDDFMEKYIEEVSKQGLYTLPGDLRKLGVESFPRGYKVSKNDNELKEELLRKSFNKPSNLSQDTPESDGYFYVSRPVDDEARTNRVNPNADDAAVYEGLKNRVVDRYVQQEKEMRQKIHDEVMRSIEEDGVEATMDEFLKRYKKYNKTENGSKSRDDDELLN